MNFTIIIIIYIISFIIMMTTMNEYLYNTDGDFKQFGVFYKSQSLFTIFPLLIFITFFSFFIGYMLF